MAVNAKRITIALAVIALTMASSAPARAELDEADLNTQPFVYGTIGAFPSGRGGGATYGVGGGMDWLVLGGLGMGFDVVAFGNSAFGFAVASFDVSYHVVPRTGRLVPFVVAGFGAGGEAGSSVAIASFGAGVNLWSGRGYAFRIEARGYVPAEGGDVNVGAQLGVTF